MSDTDSGAHVRMRPLPIDALLPEVVAALRVAPAIVVEAPPGAGKTTRIPGALLDAGLAGSGEIVVLQPRRLPARLAALRVAEERRERPGDTVGYTVRFEDVSGPRTRIRFVTEGILLRQLMANPTLPGVSVVVLDEFHERHATTDLALALLHRLQQGPRPDLRLCVMSATLDGAPIATYLGNCPRLRSEGRQFEVALEYAPPAVRDSKLDTQVAAAVRRLVAEHPEGDLLVFLPGVGEIRRCTEALEPLARAANLLILPLHGDLPLAEQARAVGPAARRKVILSTNVAETSVTIDGVTAVIDTGLARVAGHSPWTGLPTLTLAKISQASAAQRAGRAGRTRAGVAVRLYTRADHDGRPHHDTPEIARSDLAEVVLALAALGISDASDFELPTAPPPVALAAASELLRRLGAIDAGGALTERGRRMLRFPAHPRLARVLVEAEDRGVVDDAATAAALISERDIRSRAEATFGSGAAGREGGIDLIALLEIFDAAHAARFSKDRLRSLGLDGRATSMVDQARKQFAGAADRRRPTVAPPSDRLAKDRALCRAILSGFPDRVARRRTNTSRTIVLAAGGTAELAYEPDSDFLVALDVAERGRAGGGGAGETSVRLGCGIDPDWLADLDGSDLSASETLELDAATERVVRRSRLSYGSLVLDETAPPAEPSPAVAAVLAAAALARGVDSFDEPGALDRLRGRLAVVREVAPDARLPLLDGDSLRAALAAACEGLRSFAELRQVGLTERIVASLPADVRARLSAAAPATVTLPGGRAVPVHYQSDRPPWIESRLQDFFGLVRTPTIGGGRVPLTLHLLAPNGRAVQVTRDLENFWRQHYPPLRRELGRRYPRHSWPEDGLTATPPAPRPPRPR